MGRSRPLVDFAKGWCCGSFKPVFGQDAVCVVQAVRPRSNATRLLNLLPSTEARMPKVLSRRREFRAHLEMYLFGIASVLLIAVIVGYLMK
jgi:hypothetical protein